MRVTPIIMSAPMVRALLSGQKTQTRRIMKPQPNFCGGYWEWNNCSWTAREPHCPLGDFKVPVDFCPYGNKPGDLLWVRENVWLPRETSPTELREGADTWQPDYYADGITCFDIETYKQWGWKPTPSIHMPRRVSRLTLELGEVRVERLQDISEEDAMAEGCWCVSRSGFSADQEHIAPAPTAKEAYEKLWESLHGAGSWEGNPWIWALTFRIHQVNIDTYLRNREAAA